MQENDPDVLQLLDECDQKWLSAWHNRQKRNTQTNEITFVVSLPYELPQQH
jgi:hypothetical protein